MDDTQRDLFFDAEAQLLGSLFIAGSAGDLEPINAVKKIITAVDFLPNFQDKLHIRIFRAMVESTRTDYLSVAQTMHHQGTLQKGDLEYMVGLTATAIGIDCDYLAGIVAANSKEWRTGNNKARFTGGI